MSNYYVVKDGRNPGVYSTWDECKQQVDGYSGAKFKKFSSPSEASSFLNGGSSGSSRGSSENYSSRSSSNYRQSYNQSSQRESSYNSGYRPSQRSSYYRGGSYRKPDPVTVYTDGSCLGNGKNGSSAGVGVYFDDNDHRNVSERLDGLQTNNRAELTAIKRALETVRDTDSGNTARDVEIKSDSQYAINATTKWHSKWSSNGWKTADGGEVKNRDLIEDIAVLKSERAGNVKFSYVPAHSSIHGNEKADRLAVRGAQSYE
ncbi:Ribonuclease H [Smittium culicis]|uniref:Ribonuclease H n=1 Tax=Smittium culicis TaxID=133412 RepID=A0A1R1XTB5_9FUNG|nr:Ribonuclease H [Smittium culicis]